jgi:hypothetical protein
MSTQTSHLLFFSCILTVLADVRKVSDHCYITAVSRCFVMLRKQHYRAHYRPAWSNLRYSMLLNEELATLQSLGTDSRTSTSATDNGDWKILSPLCWRPSLQFRPLGLSSSAIYFCCYSAKSQYSCWAFPIPRWYIGVVWLCGYERPFNRC